MDGDGKRAVLHVEQRSLYGQAASDFDCMLFNAFQWQNGPLSMTVHGPPIATNLFDQALEIDECTSCTLLALKDWMVNRARANVEPRISGPSQLGFRARIPAIEEKDRIEPRHSDAVQWLLPEAPPAVAPPGPSYER